MSGSFFRSVHESLPEKNSTKVYLIVGVVGLVCLFIEVGLVVFSAQSHSSEYVLSTSPQSVSASSPGDTDANSTSFHQKETPPPYSVHSSVVKDSTSGPPRNTVGKVSINTASQGDLEALPAIGPKKAVKIIRGRPYKNLEEFFFKNQFSQNQQGSLKLLIEV